MTGSFLADVNFNMHPLLINVFYCASRFTALSVMELRFTELLGFGGREGRPGFRTLQRLRRVHGMYGPMDGNLRWICFI